MRVKIVIYTLHNFDYLQFIHGGGDFGEAEVLLSLNYDTNIVPCKRIFEE
jgi:hypothetical protein